MAKTKKIELVALSETGDWTPRKADPGENDSLENTLLAVLYPECQVACLTLRSCIFEIEHFSKLRSGVVYRDTRYLPVGTRQSAGQGKLFLVDFATHSKVTRRFHSCGDALITYFDHLIAPWQTLIDAAHMRVVIVPQALFGENDWRGSLRRSVASKHGVSHNQHLRFAMTFNQTQAKGDMTVIDDSDADRYGADMLLPKRSVKPFPSGMPTMFQGHVVLGINDAPAETFSRPTNNLVFNLLDEHVCGRSCGTETSWAVDQLLIIATQSRAQRAAALRV